MVFFTKTGEGVTGETDELCLSPVTIVRTAAIEFIRLDGDLLCGFCFCLIFLVLSLLCGRLYGLQGWADEVYTKCPNTKTHLTKITIKQQYAKIIYIKTS